MQITKSVSKHQRQASVEATSHVIKSFVHVKQRSLYQAAID